MDKPKINSQEPKPLSTGESAGAQAPIDQSIARPEPPAKAANTPDTPLPAAKEIGGQKGPEPTRYGDWEKNGRCTDF